MVIPCNEAKAEANRSPITGASRWWWSACSVLGLRRATFDSPFTKLGG